MSDVDTKAKRRNKLRHYRAIATKFDKHNANFM